MGATLCDTCRVLGDIEALCTESSDRLFSFTDNWPALRNLELSAASGCGFCRLLMNTLWTSRQRHRGKRERPVKININLEMASASDTGIGDDDEPGISESWNFLAGLVVRVEEVVGEFEWKPDICRFAFLLGFNNDQYPLPTSPLGEMYQGEGFYAIGRAHTEFREVARNGALKPVQRYETVVAITGLPKQVPGCSENITFLREAIDHCLRKCHPLETSDFLPTRLLDLGTDEGYGGTVCLVMTENISPKSRSIHYAALSYCWGDKAASATHSTTDSSNMNQRFTGIPVSSLSQVIQDAILTCHALSIRYLWVDSLCILQGQSYKQDWESQSQVMIRVYQHSYVTLFAASSRSCHEGFLRRRPPKPSLTILCGDAGKTSGGLASYSIIPYSPGFSDKYPNGTLWEIYNKDINEGDWSRRAWVFQEMVSSQRDIIFGNNMVHFRCASTMRLENGFRLQAKDINYQKRSVLKRVKAPFTRLEIADNTKNDENEKRRMMFNFFALQAYRYSGSDLSYETDRLPALAGIAYDVAKTTDTPGEQYLAGLWLQTLHVDLIFYFPQAPYGSWEEMMSTLSSREEYLAPSWSWASCGWQKFYLESRDDDWEQAAAWSEVSAWTVPTGINLFGQVSSGTVRMTTKTYLITASIFGTITQLRSRDTWDIDEGNRFYSFRFDFKFEARDRYDEHIAGGGVKLALVSRILNRGLPYIDGRLWYDEGFGLVLYQTGRLGEYYRVGMFSLYSFKRMLSDAGNPDSLDDRESETVLSNPDSSNKWEFESVSSDPDSLDDWELETVEII